MSNGDTNPLRPLPIQSTGNFRKNWATAYSCMGCSDSGAVLAKRIGVVGEAPWAFSCDCHRGDRYRRSFQSWSSADKHVFENSTGGRSS